MYSFIAEEKADSASEWSVAEKCRVLDVSRQGFYDWESRGRSDRELSDRMLAEEIRAIWDCSARTYGAPRVHAWLRRQGFRVSRKRGPSPSVNSCPGRSVVRRPSFLEGALVEGLKEAATVGEDASLDGVGCQTKLHRRLSLLHHLSTWPEHEAESG